MTTDRPSRTASFRRFFFRGLAILLPTALTIWVLLAAYGFIQDRIAKPINSGVRQMVLTLTPWPNLLESDLHDFQQTLDAQQRQQWLQNGGPNNRDWLRLQVRRAKLEKWWSGWSYLLDQIGLIIAIVLIYIVGVALGSYIGHSLYRRGEQFLQKIPLVKQIYPSIKQITDFVFGNQVGGQDVRQRFNRVVAVEYPRKGVWSIGLVTGVTMPQIERRANTSCMTVFIPSSPTPFTGYVIAIPKEDTIDLPITIDEALRFVVSGGVILPGTRGALQPDALNSAQTPFLPTRTED